MYGTYDQRLFHINRYSQEGLSREVRALAGTISHLSASTESWKKEMHALSSGAKELGVVANSDAY